MTARPIVSIVIPCYNVERFLADAVASAQRQTWRELDIVLVNDGSSDGTAALAARFAAEDPRITVVTKPNGGLSSARNAGIAAARGEFVCFLDADDSLLPDKIARQVEFLGLFPGCDLVYSDFYLGDSTLNPIRLEDKRPPSLPMDELLAYCNWFAPMAPLVRRTLVEAVGDFDETLTSSEDWDYWIRANRVGRFAYLPGPCAVYRTHPGQMHNNHGRMRLNQRRVIEKEFAEGSAAWHGAHAAIAWSDAMRAWFEKDYLTFGKAILTVARHAPSRRKIRNVVNYSRLG